MEKNKYAKMDKSERAKQFMPFDALKGLHEALAIKEFAHEKIEKQELLEEDVSRISNTLLQLHNHDLVEVQYFLDGHIYSTFGEVKLSLAEHFIIVGNTKIYLENLQDIKNKKVYG